MKIIDLGNSDKPYNKAKTDKDIKEPRDEALTIFIRSDKLVYRHIPLYSPNK